MSDNQKEAFDDGIPAFLKIPQKERNEAAAKLKAQREAEKAAIAVRPDLISPPAGAPIIVPDQPAKITLDKPETKVAAKKAKPVATKPKKATKKAETKEQPQQTAEPEVSSSEIPHPTTVGGRLVAKPNTKHSSRKISGAVQFPKIAAMITNKWVPRADICKALDVVDNTMRYYIGQMGHTAEYASLYSRSVARQGNDKKQSEYMLYIPG